MIYVYLHPTNIYLSSKIQSDTVLDTFAYNDKQVRQTNKVLIIGSPLKFFKKGTHPL